MFCFNQRKGVVEVFSPRHMSYRGRRVICGMGKVLLSAPKRRKARKKPERYDNGPVRRSASRTLSHKVGLLGPLRASGFRAWDTGFKMDGWSAFRIHGPWFRARGFVAQDVVFYRFVKVCEALFVLEVQDPFRVSCWGWTLDSCV